MLSVDGTTPGFLYHTAAGEIKLSDGTNTATVDIGYQSLSTYRIQAKWGTHPTEGADKLWLIVDRINASTKEVLQTWTSTVQPYVGTFTPGSELSHSFEAVEPQYLQNTVFFKEPQT